MALIGCGALGSAGANLLARAGVGALRLVDRDFVEIENLQRQHLYDQDDARRRLPKAVAATARVEEINSAVSAEAHVTDVNPDNVEEIIRGCDVVVDGTDNMETRYLVNDAAVKHGIPWIFGAAVEARGMAMAILPGRTACLRCLMEQTPAGSAMSTCDTAGVLNTVTTLVAALQTNEALRLLTAWGEASSSLLCLDAWTGQFEHLSVERRESCRVCEAGAYEYLEGSAFSSATRLCGRDMIQILPPENRALPLRELQESLSELGETTYNGYLLSVKVDGCELVLFPEGRALVKGTTEESTARKLYARCVGI